MMSRYVSVIALSLISFAGEQAYAYRWHACVGGERLKWDHTTVQFRAHAASFPITSPFRGALFDAVELWNRSPSNFRYALTFDEPHVGRRNDQNEIWFSDEIDKPAVTKYW